MGVRMEVNMRKDIVNKMHRLEMSYYDKTPIGSFISRMVSDLRDIPEFAHHAPEDFIIATVTGAGGVTFAFLQNWIIGVVFLFIIIVGIIVITFVNRKWRLVFETVRELNSEMSSSIGRQAEAISEIKSYASESFEAKLFSDIQDRYTALNRRFYKFEGMANVTSILIMASSTFIATAAGAILVVEKQIEWPQMIGLTTAAATINQPIQRFVAVYNMLARGASSVNRFFEFMDLPEEINKGKIIAKDIKGEIEFKNVDFSYVDPEGKTINVLNDFSLKIKPGETIAFVGETGIGKSTILKLLLRFYEIQKGEILVDGIDIREYETYSLRRQIGYIQQMPVIFDDTIKNNILYGKPEATPEEIAEATRASYVDDFLSKTTEGLETKIGPKGARLSGGQRQRLSIARAVLSSSPILLLDEATSALDNETEKKIKDSLNKLTEKSTTLVVAHRLSTIKDADRVLVIGKGGKIVEEGTFDKLAAKKDGHLNRLNNIH